MKNLLKVVMIVLFVSLSIYAKNNVASYSVNVQTEASLIEGVTSQNIGLNVSSANLLGDLKTSKAVIPLMRALKNSTDEGTRIAAAQALIKIGDARGVFAVKKAAEYDKSDRVRNLCSKFYFQSLTNS